MKRTILFVFFVLLLVPVYVSCEKEDDPSKQIVGTWNYEDLTGVIDCTSTLVLSKNSGGSFSYHFLTKVMGMSFKDDFDIIEWSLDNSRLFLSLFNTKTGKVEDKVWRVLALSKNELKVATEDKYGIIEFTKKKK